MALIEVKNVSKTFQTKAGKVEALKNINFNVEAGDIYGIIGMSGAGKSTLVRCLNFLEKPTKGTVTVDGKDLGSLSKKDLRATRGNIGMIFQGFNLLIQSKVIDNVLYPLRLQRMPKADAKKKAKGLLEIVGLADKANAYPAQLSVVSSRELQSQERWQVIQRFCSVMKQQVLLIHRQQNRFCSF